MDSAIDEEHSVVRSTQSQLDAACLNVPAAGLNRQTGEPSTDPSHAASLHARTQTTALQSAAAAGRCRSSPAPSPSQLQAMPPPLPTSHHSPPPTSPRETPAHPTASALPSTPTPRIQTNTHPRRGRQNATRRNPAPQERCTQRWQWGQYGARTLGNPGCPPAPKDQSR